MSANKNSSISVSSSHQNSFFCNSSTSKSFSFLKVSLDCEVSKEIKAAHLFPSCCSSSLCSDFCSSLTTRSPSVSVNPSSSSLEENCLRKDESRLIKSREDIPSVLFSSCVNSQLSDVSSLIPSYDLNLPNPYIEVSNEKRVFFRNNFRAYMLPMQHGEYLKLRGGCWFRVIKGCVNFMGHMFTPSDFYKHFLIPPEMSACILTAVNLKEFEKKQKEKGKEAKFIDKNEKNKDDDTLTDSRNFLNNNNDNVLYSSCFTDTFESCEGNESFNNHSFNNNNTNEIKDNAHLLPLSDIFSKFAYDEEEQLTIFVNDDPTRKKRISEKLEGKKINNIFKKTKKERLTLEDFELNYFRGAEADKLLNDLLQNFSILSNSMCYNNINAYVCSTKIQAVNNKGNHIAHLSQHMVKQLKHIDLEKYPVLVCFVEERNPCRNENIKDVLALSDEQNVFFIPYPWRYALNSIILDASLSNANNITKIPSVILWGEKSAGKSNFALFLINSFLNYFSTVAYLDTDVGQPTFTPPGAVSLSFLSNPVLHPPHAAIHTVIPQKTVFFGGLTARSDIYHYMNCVCKCVEYYWQRCKKDSKVNEEKNICSKLKSTSFSTRRNNELFIPLVINTHGWINGLGGNIINCIQKLCKCNFVIRLGYKMYVKSKEEGKKKSKKQENLEESVLSVSNIKENYSSCSNKKFEQIEISEGSQKQVRKKLGDSFTKKREVQKVQESKVIVETQRKEVEETLKKMTKLKDLNNLSGKINAKVKIIEELKQKLSLKKKNRDKIKRKMNKSPEKVDKKKTHFVHSKGYYYDKKNVGDKGAEEETDEELILKLFADYFSDILVKEKNEISEKELNISENDYQRELLNLKSHSNVFFDQNKKEDMHEIPTYGFTQYDEMNKEENSNQDIMLHLLFQIAYRYFKNSVFNANNDISDVVNFASSSYRLIDIPTYKEAAQLMHDTLSHLINKDIEKTNDGFVFNGIESKTSLYKERSFLKNDILTSQSLQLLKNVNVSNYRQMRIMSFFNPVFRCFRKEYPFSLEEFFGGDYSLACNPVFENHRYLLFNSPCILKLCIYEHNFSFLQNKDRWRVGFFKSLFSFIGLFVALCFDERADSRGTECFNFNEKAESYREEQINSSTSRKSVNKVSDYFCHAKAEKLLVDTYPFDFICLGFVHSVDVANAVLNMYIPSIIPIRQIKRVNTVVVGASDYNFSINSISPSSPSLINDSKLTINTNENKKQKLNNGKSFKFKFINADALCQSSMQPYISHNILSTREILGNRSTTTRKNLLRYYH